jgi:hypothetical protein
MFQVTHHETNIGVLNRVQWRAADRRLDAFVVVKMQCPIIRKAAEHVPHSLGHIVMKPLMDGGPILLGQQIHMYGIIHPNIALLTDGIFIPRRRQEQLVLGHCYADVYTLQSHDWLQSRYKRCHWKRRDHQRTEEIFSNISQRVYSYYRSPSSRTGRQTQVSWVPNSANELRKFSTEHWQNHHHPSAGLGPLSENYKSYR